MSAPDPRPPVWVGHVTMESDRIAESAAFMAALGMRTVFAGPEMAILELRGGTHLLIFQKGRIPGGPGAFDLMVEDLDAFRERVLAAGCEPSAVEHVPAMHHHRFTAREPGGNVLTFYSSHVSGPV